MTTSRELIPLILEMVDEGRIAFRPAVEISYLLKDEQEELYEAMSFADATPSLAQAIKMKEFSKNGELTPEVIESIMGEEKPISGRSSASVLTDSANLSRHLCRTAKPRNMC